MEVPRGMEPTGTNGRTRHTFQPLFGGLGLVLWWFSRWMARNAVSCGHDDDAGKAFCLRPLSGSRTATIGIVVGSVAGRRFSGWPSCIGFAVVMAQVRRPVPFRTRKLRPGTAMVLHSRGCGRVARRRILSLGVPVELRLREPPFFVCSAGQPAGARCPRFPRRAFPVARRPDYSTHRETLERRGISGISGEPLALIRWLNRLKNYALFRTQTLCRIEQNHVSRQSNSPAGRRPKLA